MTWAKLRALLMLPLIALDCLLNMLVFRNSWRNTMSAESWVQRDDPTWGWCHRFVDALFGKNHCQVQALREAAYGSVWAAWRAKYRGKLQAVTVEPTP